MGSWRKVGAFLGLVPDDNHQYEGDYDAADDDGGYAAPGGEAASYARAERPSYSGSTRLRADASDGNHHPGDGSYAAGSYASTAGHYESGAATNTSASGPARRTFGSEPVTQGALAMQADQRREAESSAASRPASVKLTGFGEARIVGEKYRDGQSVILDMTDMSDGDARRLVDFSAGLAFSLRGSIEKVAPKVFMLLPADAGVNGVAADALEDARAYAGAYAHR